MTKKILLVDDESDLLKITLLRLKMTGYDAFGAEDGKQALNLARKETPNLIVLDVYLPDIGGDEVAKILKRDEKLKNIPIILISATTHTLEKKRRECGAEYCLSKPFDPRELLEVIKKYAG